MEWFVCLSSINNQTIWSRVINFCIHTYCPANNFCSSWYLRMSLARNNNHREAILRQDLTSLKEFKFLASKCPPTKKKRMLFFFCKIIIHI